MPHSECYCVAVAGVFIKVSNNNIVHSHIMLVISLFCLQHYNIMCIVNGREYERDMYIYILYIYLQSVYVKVLIVGLDLETEKENMQTHLTLSW